MTISTIYQSCKYISVFHSQVSYFKLCLLSHFSPLYQSSVSSVSAIKEPNTYDEAAKDNRWKQAKNEELKALELSKTWEITNLPLGNIPFDCKWVYKVKCRADESIKTLKARLLAKGYRQRGGKTVMKLFHLLQK